MLEQTHVKIALVIAELLKIGTREKDLLGAGSILPDSWINFPHHREKEIEIIENLLKARLLFLENDDECYNNLGIALHYIQDKWTLRPRMKDKHTQWETFIDNCLIYSNSKMKAQIEKSSLPTKAVREYVKLLEKIRLGVKESEVTVFESFGPTWELPMLKFSQPIRGFGAKVLAFALMKRPTNWSTPQIDFNFAFRISWAVAKSVVLPLADTPDILTKELKEELNSLSERLRDFPNSYFKKGWNFRDLKETIKRHNLSSVYYPHTSGASISKKGLLSPSFRISLTKEDYIDFSSRNVASYVAHLLRTKGEITKDELLNLKIPSEQNVDTVLFEYQEDKRRSIEMRKSIEELKKQDPWTETDLLKRLISDIENWKFRIEIRKSLKRLR